jgi:hypothetical protein
MVLEVDCHAGQYGDRIPHAFRFGRRAIMITEVLDRWLAAHHGYFKVQSGEGDTYLLRHDARDGIWEMILFQAG